MVYEKGLVRLVKINIVEKDGKTLRFIKIADPQVFDVDELMPVHDMDLDSLVIGQDYKARVHISGRYSNLELVPLKG
ncbi:MAG: hypothetical protein IJT84_00930 [Clostridia bacterium]|nr:hypothetical protein [Clostridia bacterium]